MKLNKKIAIFVAALMVMSAAPLAQAGHDGGDEVVTGNYGTSSGVGLATPSANLSNPDPAYTYAAITLCPDAFRFPTDPNYFPFNGSFDPVGNAQNDPDNTTYGLTPFGDSDTTGTYGCGNPEPEPGHVGSATLYAEHGEYGGVEATVRDGFWSQPAHSLCLWNASNMTSNNCADDAHSGTNPGCSASSTIEGFDEKNQPFKGVRATVFVFTLFVDFNLAVCGGTTGDVQATFFNA